MSSINTTLPHIKTEVAQAEQPELDFDAQKVDKNPQFDQESTPENNIELHKAEELKQDSSKDEQNIRKEKSSLSKFYNELREFIPVKGAVLTSLGHFFAAMTDLKSFGTPFQKLVDKLSFGFSKIMLTSNNFIQAKEALKENRMWEVIANLIEPIFILVEKNVEDLSLARGIGLGLMQLVGSQRGIHKDLKKKAGLEDKKLSPMQDHKLNVKAFKKIFSEIFQGGAGSKRRFLTGFTASNLKEKMGQFFKEFNFSSIKYLFNNSDGKTKIQDKFKEFCKRSGLQRIHEICEGDKDKDKGHTDALSGALMIAGSLLGYVDKASRGFMYKLGGTLRSVGGNIADIAIFGNPDPYHNLSALFLEGNIIMDIFQRFIPADKKNLIKPWGNMSMALYNIGVGLYLNQTNRVTNEKDSIIIRDSDLQEEAKQHDQKLSESEGNSPDLTSEA